MPKKDVKKDKTFPQLDSIAKIVALCISLAAPGVTLINMLSIHKAEIATNKEMILTLVNKVDNISVTVSSHEASIGVLRQQLMDSSTLSSKLDNTNNRINTNFVDIWKRISANTTQIQQNRIDIELIRRTKN